MQALFTMSSGWVLTWIKRMTTNAKHLINFFAKLTLELTLCLGCEGAMNRELTLGILLIIVAFAMHMSSESQ